MKLVVLLLITLKLCSSGVIHVSYDEFEQIVRENKTDKGVLLVKSDDCKICGQLEENLKRAEILAKEQNINIDFFTVNTKNDVNIHLTLKIKETPALILFDFKNKNKYSLSTQIPPYKIVNEVKIKLLTRIIEVSSTEEMLENIRKSEFKPSNKVILFLSNNLKLQSIFKETALEAYFNHIFISKSISLESDFDKEGIYLLKFNNILSKPYFLADISNLTAKQIFHKLIKYSFPPVSYLTKDNIRRISRGEKALVYVYKTKNQQTRLYEALSRLSIKYEDLNFFYINFFDSDALFFLNLAGREVEDELIFLIEPGEQFKLITYLKRANFEEEDIDLFIQDFFRNKLEPLVHSEEKPVKDGNLLKITGKTAKNLILEETKGVLLLACRFNYRKCSQTLEFYRFLASRIENVKFMFMDYTYNTLEFLEFKTEPAIWYFPTSNNKLESSIAFEGDLTLLSFKDFIENMGHPLNISPTEEELYSSVYLQETPKYEFDKPIEGFAQKLEERSSALQEEKLLKFKLENWIDWNESAILPTEMRKSTKDEL